MNNLAGFKRLSFVRNAVALCVLVAGCEKEAPASTPVQLTVAVSPVIRNDGVRELHLSGTLSAERTLSLGFATVGTVAQVKVQEGQVVKKGEVLARLITSSYEDALRIAEVKLKQAEDAYRRLQPLHQNRTIPEIQMVEVETGRTQARLAVSLARRNLSDTELRAPIAGTVSNRRVEPGMTVMPGVPAFTLVQVETLLATAPVPELLVAKVKPGANATVTVPAIGLSLAGEVREIAVTANPLTRTYDIKVSVSNQGGLLRVGMIADIDLRLNGEEGGLVVPPEAVRVNELGAHHVFVVDGSGKLHFRRVRVTRFLGTGVVLSGGVREGELVVTSGTPMLSDGAVVRVATAPATGARP